jgi:malonate-semialdehyde dehydrogenase (acetylating)/methylmalonate-semialdehyde dehydrogenase
MPQPASDVRQVPLLHGGVWEQSTSDRWGEVFNPSSGEQIASVPLCSAEEIDKVVQTAAKALPQWSETPIVERARVMFRFRALLEANFEELAAILTREHGKTLAESRAEMNRGVEMVEFAAGFPSLPIIFLRWFHFG